MQFLIIVLAVALLAHDSVRLGSEELSSIDLFSDAAESYGVAPLLVLVVWTIMSRGAIAVAYALACRITLLGMVRSGTSRGLRRLERFGLVTRLLLAGLYVADLFVGGLSVLRDAVFDVVLIDELIFMLPTLVVIGTCVAWYYPVEMRIRLANAQRALRVGEPTAGVLTRGQFVLSQLRHQVGVIFVPMLMLFAWLEFVSMHVPPNLFGIAADIQPYAVLGGAGAIFLFAPEVIRRVWDTVPLPAGEVRDRLLAMCKLHRVGVRNLLLWRTFGGMINAAVMGVIAPLRYILLTDALLERVPAEEVEAVMAHELAHVRRHHIFWLVAIAWQLAWLLGLAVSQGLEALDAPIAVPIDTPNDGLLLAGMFDLTREQVLVLLQALVVLAGFALWALGFGWVSRRFERQADTFAVQHMTIRGGDAGKSPVIKTHAVLAMTSALQHVADLNHIAVAGRSWRHGSILWRQTYLRTLVGQRVDQLGIDRLIRVLKLISLTLIVVGIVSSVLAYRAAQAVSSAA